MCLTYLKPLKQLGTRNIGWKIFKEVKGELYSPQFSFKYDVGVWMEDPCNWNIRIAYTEDWYKTGFHIYLDPEEADRNFSDYEEWVDSVPLGIRPKFRYVLKKVEFEEPTAIGVQDDSEVVVARRIKICV